MVEMKFQQIQGDHFLFIKRANNGKVTALMVIVDDIIVTGDYFKEINLLKGWLAREFGIKDLGRLRYFLGIEVAH